MLERNLLIPVLLVVVVGAPIVYHEMKPQQPTADLTDAQAQWSSHGSPPSYPQSVPDFDGSRLTSEIGSSTAAETFYRMPTRNLSRPHVVPAEQPFQLSGYRQNVENPVQNNPFINPANQSRSFDPQLIPVRGSENSAAAPPQPVPPRSAPVYSAQPTQTPSQAANTSLPQPSSPMFAAQAPAVMTSPIDFSNMTPDYGAAETLVFPGNEFGPDLTAAPLGHLPVQDFGEIFQFNLTKPSIQQRWKRISTNPMDFRSRLSGMRIPVVTGTNSWDLHGSLTYYFDTEQQLQRITFRGWTGDPQKLLNWLTSQYQFKPQPTSLAGFYLGETRRKTHGGIMLKSPPVIDANNPFQQYGIVMEMNRPEGSYELSDEYRRLIAGSHPQ